MKWIFWILGILVLGFLLFTEELYRYVFCRRTSRLFCRLFDTKGHEEAYYAYREAGVKLLDSLPQETFLLESCRGETLRGHYYPQGSQGKKIAVIVHGYRSDHADTAALCCRYYMDRGIDFFAMDHTASGESAGRFIGFDVFETEDSLRWVDFLIEKFGPDTQLLLHGFSMGAATVMRMSSRCPENVKFIVEDSGFRVAGASMRQQVKFMYEPLRLLNRWIAGYDWNDSDVTASLKRSRIPMLFVHGREDKLVPFENGPFLYSLYEGEKDCLFPEKTRHIESMYTSGQEYAEKLDRYMMRYMK